MKKYFLIVLLFALMFLGLGNYSMGQDNITEGTPIDLPSSSTWTTESNAPTNPSSTQIYQTVSDDQLTPVSTTETIGIDGTPCPDSKLKGGHYNAVGNCVCDETHKEVKGVCKDCNLPEVCCGVELNTNVPFIGKCLEDEQYAEQDPTVVSQERAFPVLMGSLTQILVTVILIVSFVLIVVGGIMIATGNPKGGKDLLMKVVIGIALLGASGVILRLINPNFFG